MSRTIRADQLSEGMTVRRITQKVNGELDEVPVQHRTGDPWPTVTRVEYPDPYGTVWFTLSCCDSEAVRVAPDDEITVEEPS